jgi:hypothetical protein
MSEFLRLTPLDNDFGEVSAVADVLAEGALVAFSQSRGRLETRIRRQRTPGGLRVLVRPTLVAAAVLMGIAALLSFPASRAAAQAIVDWIGHLIVTRGSTWAEHDIAADEAPTEVQAEPLSRQFYDPGAASEAAGFPVLVPSYVPNGYIRQPISVVRNEQGAFVSLSYGGEGVIQIVAWRLSEGSEKQEFPIGDASITDVEVLSVRGKWIEGMKVAVVGDSSIRYAPGNDNVLIWAIDDVDYFIYTYGVGSDPLSLDEVLRIANSMSPPGPVDQD